jgi:hypothetical protein
MALFDKVELKSKRPQAFSISGLSQAEVELVAKLLKKEASELAQSILKKMGEKD